MDAGMISGCYLKGSTIEISPIPLIHLHLLIPDVFQTTSTVNIYSITTNKTPPEVSIICSTCSNPRGAPLNAQRSYQLESDQRVDWRSLSCPSDSCLNPVIPAESGGIIFGREPCQNCHSGDQLFWWNWAIPELRLEWSRNGPERIRWNAIK